MKIFAFITILFVTGYIIISVAASSVEENSAEAVLPQSNETKSDETDNDNNHELDRSLDRNSNETDIIKLYYKQQSDEYVNYNSNDNSIDVEYEEIEKYVGEPKIMDVNDEHLKSILGVIIDEINKTEDPKFE